MGVPALAEKESRRVISISLTGEHEKLLRAIADARFDGSLSAAARYLLELYAGRDFSAEIEEARFDVSAWRKPRLSRELASTIAGQVRAGNLRTDAYILAGVSKAQASRWLARGRSDVNAGTPSLYADFVFALERAEAELKAEQVAEAKRKGDYKFILSRQFPDQYGERKRTDSTVTHALAPLIVWENYTVAEARTLVALLRKGSPDADDPAISRTARPVAELIPAEMIDGEALEVDDESTSTSNESPASSESPVASERLALEAGPPGGAPAAGADRPGAADVDARHELERESAGTVEPRADRE